MPAVRILVIVLGLCSGFVSGLDYVILGLGGVEPGRPFPVSILVFHATSDVKIDMALVGQRHAGQLVFSSSALIQDERLTTLEISVGDLSAMTADNMTLYINGADSSAAFSAAYPNIYWNAAVRKPVEDRDALFPKILIQTDQPQCQAGDTVRFRVVSARSVDDRQQPMFVRLNVQIVDPLDNVVKEFNNDNGSEATGYFAGEMSLSADPLLGEWRVRVVNASVGECPAPEPTTPAPSDCMNIFGCFIPYNKNPILAIKPFFVYEFISSRFEVTITDAKTNIVPSVDKEIRFKVSAKYSSGKPVKGIFDVAIVVWHRNYSHTTSEFDVQYVIWLKGFIPVGRTPIQILL
ncbi:thioester-containing protein 1 allele R1-like [Paramacrobiotus metropolitanus]|uniref:thioester-containing protein 1 allele R1-like n=1 Tax=Paramacrobiotus metropolitanus TaxID=2943436 RepID=UPI00244591B5|nr:thioester-containing protein 1 allele R1-like [Paramacrobiotus metropolitanus]